MVDRTLDRNPSLDPRNDDHLYLPLHKTVTRRIWHPAGILDQGQIGGCVGFGWTGALGAQMPLNWLKQRSRMNRIDEGVAHYILASALDNIKGEYPNSDTGSTVLAGAKAAQALGYITKYEWLKDIGSITHAILSKGPVVIGVPFYNSMFELSDDYYMRVVVTSGEAGGHCMYLAGAGLHDDYYVGVNSWGTSWGNSGGFRISQNDFQILLDNGAEACVATLA